MEVRVAIFYATLINIVAVIPVMLVGGLTGAFFEPLAIAYGLAVLASMLVALTVTPALGLMLMPSARLGVPGPAAHAGAQARLPGLAAAAPRRRPPGRRAVPGGARGGRSPRSSRWRSSAAWSSTRTWAQDLFPTFKEPDFLMHFVTKPGTSVQEQDRMVANLQDQVLKVPGVTNAGSHIGQAMPGEEISGVNFSETWLSLSPSANYGQAENDLRNLAD